METGLCAGDSRGLQLGTGLGLFLWWGPFSGPCRLGMNLLHSSLPLTRVFLWGCDSGRSSCGGTLLGSVEWTRCHVTPNLRSDTEGTKVRACLVKAGSEEVRN